MLIFAVVVNHDVAIAPVDETGAFGRPELCQRVSEGQALVKFIGVHQSTDDIAAVGAAESEHSGDLNHGGSHLCLWCKLRFRNF